MVAVLWGPEFEGGIGFELWLISFFGSCGACKNGIVVLKLRGVCSVNTETMNNV